MTIIAYATFDHHDVDLLQAVSAEVLHMPSAFDPQAIANTLWALALLEDLSPPVWNCLLVTFVQAERFNSKITGPLGVGIAPYVSRQLHMPSFQVQHSVSTAHTQAAWVINKSVYSRHKSQSIAIL